MSNDYEVIVAGLGANGSAAIYQLAKAGKKVLGIDKFKPPHTMGSSHGETRIIREAYYESPKYVPFIQEAYKLWHELENASGKELFLKTGGLMIGKADSALVTGSKLSAETHAIPFEYLLSNEIKERFPAFKPATDDVAIFEFNAGILFPEACIEAYLTLAGNFGATLHYHETILNILSSDNKIVIRTNKNRYTADKLIVTTGAWLGEMMHALALPLTIARQVLHWFTLQDKESKRADLFLPENFPIYIWEFKPDCMFYGFPDVGSGIKIACHHLGSPATVNTINRNVSADEVAVIQAMLEDHFEAQVNYSHSATCMYTNTPDENFIIDYHPQNPNIIIASPCSGHGFKFSSAIGKVLCEMVSGKELSIDLSLFKINRFHK